MQVNTTAGCDFELLKGFQFECLVFVYSIIVSVESILVVVIICRTKALHTNSDIIVGCLSLTDILLCASYTAHGVKSLAGSTLSKSQKNYLVSFLCGACYGGVLISITHLGFAAIDRYVQIAYPFYYIKHMTKRRLFKKLLAIWLIGGMYTLTPLFLYFYRQNSETCILLHPPLAYFFILFTGYLANIMIVFISYLKIARLAFQHKKSANIRRMQIEDRTSTVIFSQNRKGAIKSVNFFIVMFGAFLSVVYLTSCCSNRPKYCVKNASQHICSNCGYTYVEFLHKLPHLCFLEKRISEFFKRCREKF